MKKKSKLLLVLLTVVCMAVAAFGLTACGDKPEGDGDKTVVIKVGNTVIGDVTADGVTFDVEGEVGTSYNVYARTIQNGTLKNDSDVIIKYVGDEGLGTRGGPYEFQYVAGLKLNFAGNNKTVENVTVVMEKVQTSIITPPTTTEYALTVETPVVLENLTGTVSVKFNTETGKTYTVTALKDGEIYNDILFGLAGMDAGTYEYEGNGEEAKVSFRSQSGTATDVTIRLTVADAGSGDDENDDYPVVTLGQAVTVSGASMFEPVIYVVEITEAGNYTFSGGIAIYDIAIDTTVSGGDIVEPLLPTGENDDIYQLEAGKYYIAFYADGTVTMVKNA